MAPGPSPAAHRVLYLLYRYPQVSQTFVRDEIQSLRARGTEVDVVSVGAGDTAQLAPDWGGQHRHMTRPTVLRGLRDHAWFARRHPGRYRRFMRTVLLEPDQRRAGILRLPTEARGLLLGSRPSHVHSHFAWSTATLAAGIAQLLDVPASITVHAKDIYTTPTPTLKRRLEHFDPVVTVCRYNVGFMDGRGVVPPGKAPIVIPCSVALAEDPPWGDGIDVLTVGRLVPKKGIDDLLRAFAQVGGTAPEAEVTVIGDGPERGALEHLADDLGIAPRVHFLGSLPHAEVLERMAQAKIFCLAAKPAADGDIDAMPVVLREAMARAVAVVTTSLTGIPESVDDHVGWLVPPNDVPALAHALEAALTDEPERRRRGDAGRARARDAWTEASQAEALLRHFGRT